MVPGGVNVISDGMCVCEGGLNLAFTVLCSGEMPTVGGFFLCVCVGLDVNSRSVAVFVGNSDFRVQEVRR